MKGPAGSMRACFCSSVLVGRSVVGYLVAFSRSPKKLGTGSHDENPTRHTKTPGNRQHADSIQARRVLASLDREAHPSPQSPANVGDLDQPHFTPHRRGGRRTQRSRRAQGVQP